MSEQKPMQTRRQQDKAIDTQIEVSRHERARTIIYSILAAGLVSLFIGHAFEVQASNDQADRSRKNCEFLNDRLRISAAKDAAQADQTLGNPTHTDKNGNPAPIPPADFDKPPYEQFKGFKALIIAQAVQNRKDSQDTINGIKDCNEVFPKSNTFWIVG